MNSELLAIGMPGTFELILIAGAALLIFGRRLPDVARSVGRSIVEFKRGIRDVKDDMDTQATIAPPTQPKIEQKHDAPPTASSADQADTAATSTTPPAAAKDD